jgi:hypothetical protein
MMKAHQKVLNDNGVCPVELDNIIIFVNIFVDSTM